MTSLPIAGACRDGSWSEAHDAIGQQTRFGPLSQPRQIEAGGEIARRFVVAPRFRCIQYPAFYSAGDADHEIDLMTLREFAPALRYALLIRSGNLRCIAAINAVVIKKYAQHAMTGGGRSARKTIGGADRLSRYGCAEY